MFPDMLAEDRRRRGFTVGQVAWRLGVSPREYREFEAGTRDPDFETWDAMCKLYGSRLAVLRKLLEKAPRDD